MEATVGTEMVGQGFNGVPAATGEQVVIAAPQAHWTCHQCRQRKTEATSACSTVKKSGMLCPMKYCKKCMHNRYGEVATESWTCPKCRGQCNCSICRTKKGETPTGRMVSAAKASGCPSVKHLLDKGPDAVAAALQLATPLKLNATAKGKQMRDAKTTYGDYGTGELPVEEGENNLSAVSSIPNNKRLKGNLVVDDIHDVVLPMGTIVTRVVGAELDTKDIGPAIHFLEFCRSFAQILQLRKGQSEEVIQEITTASYLRAVPSIVSEIHINLLSILQEDGKEKPYSSDSDEWIVDIGKYVNKSVLLSRELTLDFLNKGVLGYQSLSPSCKLHILNSLCDETLSTKKMRSWIAKSVVTGKKCAPKEKEKELKDRLYIEDVEEKKSGTGIDGPDMKELGGVLRMKPIMVDRGGAYWKLDGYYNNTTILRQEFENDNEMGNNDKWFTFTKDEEKVIEQRAVSVSRRQRRSRGRA